VVRLPQIAGLGFSAMAQRFAIESRGEAVAYLAHDVLGPRLIECARLVMAAASERTIDDILGSPDDMKFRSSIAVVRLRRKAGDFRGSHRGLLPERKGSGDNRNLADPQGLTDIIASVEISMGNRRDRDVRPSNLRGVRYAVQQKGLQGGGEVLVAELHST
jgi:Protein of unknown function (DUF1810)